MVYSLVMPRLLLTAIFFEHHSCVSGICCICGGEVNQWLLAKMQPLDIPYFTSFHQGLMLYMLLTLFPWALDAGFRVPYPIHPPAQDKENTAPCWHRWYNQVSCISENCMSQHMQSVRADLHPEKTAFLAQGVSCCLLLAEYLGERALGPVWQQDLFSSSKNSAAWQVMSFESYRFSTSSAWHLGDLVYRYCVNNLREY